jgi:wobble nucleotide-excising tRNase
MITNIQLLRNVGRFDSVTTAASIPLNRITMIYAENGQGKTTLAAILRSLATGDPIPIIERRRLASQHPPHVMLACSGGPPPAAMFQNGAWNRTLPNMVVFDDVFVDQNVYSGLVVGSEHRQNLHELILGAQGIALNQQLQRLVQQIENHNSTLRQRALALVSSDRGSLSADDFCALPNNPNVDQEIQTAERNIAALRAQDPIRSTPGFDLFSLPPLDVEGIAAILNKTVQNLDAAAAREVQAHVASVGNGSEEWISEGIRRQLESESTNCVFCAQDLAGSPVIPHYEAFFSSEYRELQRQISEALATLNSIHSGNAAATFERAVRVLVERKQFWAQFCELPPMEIDTATVVQDWQNATRLLIEVLTAKQASPLEPLDIPDAARSAVLAYEGHLALVASINQLLQQSNATIAAVRQRAATANPIVEQATLARLRAIRARHSPAVAALCDLYVGERRAKTATEQLRDHARAALEQHRTTVFPTSQAAVNRYLTQFNAGFQLDSVVAANTRGGPSCTYNVVINDVPIAVGGSEPQPGDHSFRNTLSAGDRNALALAFFFATLELDPNIADKIVVIDDPVSSLDEHRSLTTIQEIRRLAVQAAQVILLSHTKNFLGEVWEGTDQTLRTALHLTRDGNGSTISIWNVDLDRVTEHDKRHEALRQYSATGVGNEREIATAIRPLLEAFIRVAYPEYCPPGTLLGPFRGLCEQRLNTPQQILNPDDTAELRNLIDYANRFHHDTNPAWQTANINSAELTGFVNRALAFAKRRD